MAASVPVVDGVRLGVVVGSNLTADPLPGGVVERIEVTGRDGAPATVDLIDHGPVVVLHRHGPSSVPASMVDHHANVRALCAAGCDRVVALASTGALRAHLSPGMVVAPDDLLALGTYPSFHGTTAGYGTRGFDLGWRAAVLETWRAVNTTPIVDGGTYAMTIGPRFETPAEVRMLAAHADVVGMTLAAECFLAAEAGLRYMALCTVDNMGNGIVAGEDPLAAHATHTAAGADALRSDLVALIERLSRSAGETGGGFSLG
ncbi:MAG: hypothetical protein ABIV94_06010 [Acidimicrobiales bacterium]